MNYKKIKNSLIKIGFFKIGVVLTNFFITSILISIIGFNNYGVYASIFSLMTWFYLFDFGIAKGMRNHLTNAVVNKNEQIIKKLISTAYIASFFICLSLLFFVLFTISNINISSFLNIKIYDDSEISSVLNIFIIIMFSKLFFSSIEQIFYVLHKSHLNTLLLLIVNFVYLVLLIFCKYQDINDLKEISLMYAFSLVFSYVVISIWFFYNHKNFRPKPIFFSINLLKKIFSDGFKILLIQLMFFCYLSLDRFLLLKYSNELTVANYDILYKVMSVLLFPWSIISQPLWSSYAEAFSRCLMHWLY